MKREGAESGPVSNSSPYVLQVDAHGGVRFLDIYLTAKKRWRWFLGGLVIGVACTLLYFLLVTPIYESRAVISIGKIHDAGPIEDAETVIAQLMDKYGLAAEDGGPPYLRRVNKGPGNGITLTLVAVGHSPREAQEFLSNVTAKLLSRHEKLYALIVDPMTQRLATIDARISVLRSQIEEMNDVVRRLKSTQASQASLASIERALAYTERNDLERDRLLLQHQLLKTHTGPTTVVSAATLTEQSLRDGKIVTLFMALGIGAFSGLLAALFRELLGRRADAVMAGENR